MEPVTTYYYRCTRSNKPGCLDLGYLLNRGTDRAAPFDIEAPRSGLNRRLAELGDDLSRDSVPWHAVSTQLSYYILEFEMQLGFGVSLQWPDAALLLCVSYPLGTPVQPRVPKRKAGG